MLATLTAMAACGLHAQTAADAGKQSPLRPQLVVQVLVEGLDADRLDLLTSSFGPDGFRRLMRDGVELRSVSYGPGPDAVAATAMVATGAAAELTGIDHATDYDPERRTWRFALADSALSVRTGRTVLSPGAIPVSTLADELAVAEDGLARIYSVGADPQTVLLLTGHAGSNAFWISDENGAWTTSPYYSDIPAEAASHNFGARALAARLDTIRWAPMLDPKSYPGVSATKAAYPFRHVFQRNNPDRYRAFKASARGNSDVTDMAASLLQAMQAAPRQGVTEMVNVVYTLAPYPFSKDPDSRLETLDAYVRLDADLARLMQAVDSHGPGMDRTLMVVAGVPAPASGKRDDERFRIPYGRFSARKAQSLLNMYLMAKHGEGAWVSGYHNGGIHLNRSLIDSRGLDRAEVRREAAALLRRMAGVRNAITLDDLYQSPHLEPLRRNTDAAQAADVLLQIAPGWETVETDGADGNELPRPQVSRLAPVTCPAFILAPGLGAATVEGEVDARALAPTMARLLRIRAPNGASAPPLRLTDESKQ